MSQQPVQFPFPGQPPTNEKQLAAWCQRLWMNLRSQKSITKSRVTSETGTFTTLTSQLVQSPMGMFDVLSVTQTFSAPTSSLGVASAISLTASSATIATLAAESASAESGEFGSVTADSVDAESVGAAAAEIGSLVVGDQAGGNWVEIGENGIKLHGTATCYRDEFGPLIGSRLEVPGSHIVALPAEGTLEFKTTCVTTDYVVLTPQINHDWAGTTVKPHIHWKQESATIPHWLIQYRWQIGGAAWSTAWTSVKWAAHAFTYTSGAFNQITGFGALTPPASPGLSPHLQLRLTRDTTNASGLFTGTDQLNAAVQALSYDIHIEVDGFASNLEYEK